MRSLHTFIEGDPVAMPRPMARARGGRAQVYTPTVVKRKAGNRPHPWVPWHHAIVQHLADRKPANELRGAVMVSLVFTFTVPPSRSRPAHGWHTDKPDADNLAKLVLDAMQLPALQERGLHVIHDDSQVASLTVAKRWAELLGDGQQRPGLLLTASELR